MRIMADANVKPVFIPPHSSHCLQAEDLETFSLLKRELRKAN
jgi:hypothetical protein